MFSGQTELARHPNTGLRYAAVTTTNSDSSIRLPVASVTVELWRRNFRDRQTGQAFRNLGQLWAVNACTARSPLRESQPYLGCEQQFQCVAEGPVLRL